LLLLLLQFCKKTFQFNFCCFFSLCTDFLICVFHCFSAKNLKLKHKL
jgi:hypothetical protein